MLPFHRFFHLVRMIFTFCTLALLSACGGGGGGDEPPTLGNPAWFLGTEYTNNYALALVNARVLYEQGSTPTGEGIVVAVLDSGIDIDHPDFAGRIDLINSQDFEAGGSTDGDFGAQEFDDQSGHGTWVSGVIAANFDGDTSGSGIHGIAFESTIIAFDVTKNDHTPSPLDDGLADADIISALNRIRDLKIAYNNNPSTGSNIQVVNMSFGGGGNAPLLNAAMKEVTDLGIAIVISAGNYNGVGAAPDISQPAFQAGGDGTNGALDYNGLIVAAAATGSSANGLTTIDSGGNDLPYIAEYSHKCNSVDNRYCISAPGTSIPTTDIGGGYATVSGTSFSAPMVAGAIALLVEAGGITPAEAIEILLQTALDPIDPVANPTETNPKDGNMLNNNDGKTAATTFDFVNDIYGTGFLYLTGALAPQGAVSIATGSNRLPLEGANLTPAAAFGDAFSVASAFHNAVMLDSYDRPYVINVADFVSAVKNNVNMAGFNTIFEEIETDSFEADKVTFAAMRTSKDPLAHPAAALEEEGVTGISMSYQSNRSTKATITTGSYTGTKATFAFSERATDSFHITDSVAAPFGYMTNGGQRIALQKTRGQWVTEFGLTAANQDFGQVTNFHVNATRSLGQGWQVGIQAEAIFENQSFLGTLSEGAFDSGYSAGTFAATFGIGYSEGPVEIFAQLTQGWTKTESDGFGLLDDFATIKTQAALIGLSIDNIFHSSDRFTLSYSEPLRVTSGSASYQGELTGDETNGNSVSLVPTGLQRNLELSYRRSVSRLTSWGIGLAVILDPNHSAYAENEAAFGFKLQHQF